MQEHRIAIEPVWDQIDRVRSYVTEALSEETDSAIIDAIVMVASELTENALKYGCFAADDKIEVLLEKRQQTITVEVRNPMAEGSAEHLEKLDGMIQWIRGHQDPFEAYLQRMEEVARQSIDSTESGLGLVRIAYEGRSVLDFYVDEHDMLAVSAVLLQ